MVTVINGHREETHKHDVDVRIVARGAIVVGYVDAQREAARLGGMAFPVEPLDLDCDTWEVLALKPV